jgi:hypothetical protein
MDEVVDRFIEITLRQDEDFLKVKETLTRIGVASRRQNRLFQTCHILHKKGRYYIVHFKEMFLLDGKPTSLCEADIGRRNTIANLLSEWGLVDLVHTDMCSECVPLSQIKILAFRDKQKWELIPKYTIGRPIQ